MPIASVQASRAALNPRPSEGQLPCCGFFTVPIGTTTLPLPVLCIWPPPRVALLGPQARPFLCLKAAHGRTPANVAPRSSGVTAVAATVGVVVLLAGVGDEPAVVGVVEQAVVVVVGIFAGILATIAVVVH